MPYIEYDKYYTGKLCEMLWHVKDNARVLILVLLLCCLFKLHQLSQLFFVSLNLVRLFSSY